MHLSRGLTFTKREREKSCGQIMVSAISVNNECFPSKKPSAIVATPVILLMPTVHVGRNSDGEKQDTGLRQLERCQRDNSNEPRLLHLSRTYKVI